MMTKEDLVLLGSPLVEVMLKEVPAKNEDYVLLFVTYDSVIIHIGSW